MVAKGQSNDQALIEYRVQIFQQMLDDFPQFIDESIRKIEGNITKDAEYVSGEDSEIKSNILNSDGRWEAILAKNQIIEYYYDAMTMIIYSFAESFLKYFSKKQHSQRKNASVVENFYNEISEKYATLPSLFEIWPTYKNFNTIRNSIAHDFDTKHSPSQLLTDIRLNLDSISTMLLKIERVINNQKNTEQ